MVQIELKRENILNLAFHLKVMRKAVQKGLKKKYSRSEVKEHMELYDSIYDSFPTVSDDLDREDFTLELSEKQYKLLKDFLQWYEEELKKGLDNNTTEKQIVGLEMLQEAKKKVDEAVA